MAGSSGSAGSTGISGTGAGPSNDAGAGGDSPDGGSGGAGALGGISGGIGAAGDTGGGTAGGGGAVGGGGAAGGAGAGGGSGIEEIDYFENGTTTLPPVSGRNGPWYTFNDATAGGKQTPLAQLLTPLTGANARTGSSSSNGFHMTASGFTNYGAGLGADFVNLAAQKVAYDISVYKSIQFYAKIGSGAQSAVKLLLPNVYSDSMGAKCVGTSSSTGTACNDHLFCQFNGLTTAWALYKCDFSALQQGGFGLVQAKPYDLTKSYSMQFSFATTPAVDFWLDDMSFVLK